MQLQILDALPGSLYQLLALSFHKKVNVYWNESSSKSKASNSLGRLMTSQPKTCTGTQVGKKIVYLKGLYT